jgi:glycosyltransferase involved in cell wall biosynthesis
MTSAGGRASDALGIASQDAGLAEHGLPQVWIFQPSVKHYRLPLWDLLVERSRGRYQISVFGPLDIDHANIESRPYLQEMPLHRRLMLGREVAHWGGAARMIRRERPSIVVLTATVSFFGSWSLPRVAHRAGATVVGWSKVNSRAGHTTWLERQVKRTFFRRFDYFLCYGQNSRAELESLGYPAERIRVAQNTIDTRRIFGEAELLAARGEEIRREWGLAGKKLLLCIGRMIPQKRQADLISAWPDVQKVDPDLSLVFVGGGELLEGLRTAAEETDAERIIFTGPVPEGDDYAWIATADLVVLPGAVGLALNQAMALGRVIVMADEPGADAEILRDGETGWRYPRGDIQALSSTIRVALSNPAESQRRAQAARRYIAEHATIERMVDVIDATLVEASRRPVDR